MRKIAIATSTRADWGLLSPLARLLSDTPGVEISIIATNMHLDIRRGYTVDEIVSDGFEIAARIPMDFKDDSPKSAVKAMAQCVNRISDAFEQIKPDSLIILGDRYEMLAIASAATVMRIPIIHIAGGEISEGAIDDNIRHAITKLSSLHLTATEPYRRRVIAMGEQPERVINTGALGVHNIMSLSLMNKETLEKSIGFSFDSPTLLITIHPATADDTPVETAPTALFEALDRFHEVKAIVTYPNNDSRGGRIIEIIDKYAAENTEKIKVIPSLGRLRYLSALQFVKAVVGNSSSGIVEVPSMKIPTVNIGPRQNGRIAADSVINCNETVDDIERAIRFALSEDGQKIAKNTSNPYYKPDTLRVMADAILSVPVEKLRVKRFYDIK